MKLCPKSPDIYSLVCMPHPQQEAQGGINPDDLAFQEGPRRRQAGGRPHGEQVGPERQADGLVDVVYQQDAGAHRFGTGPEERAPPAGLFLAVARHDRHVVMVHAAGEVAQEANLTTAVVYMRWMDRERHRR